MTVPYIYQLPTNDICWNRYTYYTLRLDVEYLQEDLRSVPTKFPWYQYSSVCLPQQTLPNRIVYQSHSVNYTRTNIMHPQLSLHFYLPWSGCNFSWILDFTGCQYLRPSLSLGSSWTCFWSTSPKRLVWAITSIPLIPEIAMHELGLNVARTAKSITTYGKPLR